MYVTRDKHINQIKPVSQRKILCFFSYELPRFYIDTQNYVCIYDDKVEMKLSREAKGINMRSGKI